MTLPKKNSHKISVGGVTYLWYRSTRFETHDRWIAIRKKGTDGQLVLLDHYHNDLSFGAGPVAKAIEFAISHGWAPEAKGAPIKLRYNGDNFQGEPFTVLHPSAKLSDRHIPL